MSSRAPYIEPPAMVPPVNRTLECVRCVHHVRPQYVQNFGQTTVTAEPCQTKSLTGSRCLTWLGLRSCRCRTRDSTQSSNRDVREAHGAWKIKSQQTWCADISDLASDLILRPTIPLTVAQLLRLHPRPLIYHLAGYEPSCRV